VLVEEPPGARGGAIGSVDGLQVTDDRGEGSSSMCRRGKEGVGQRSKKVEDAEPAVARWEVELQATASSFKSAVWRLSGFCLPEDAEGNAGKVGGVMLEMRVDSWSRNSAGEVLQPRLQALAHDHPFLLAG
jgi:hypothetical protein